MTGTQVDTGEPVRVYTHRIGFDDGSFIDVDRRERPDYYDARHGAKGAGEPTHLLTAVLYAGRTRCVVQPISPPAG